MSWVQCPICGGDVGDEAVADYDRAAYETGVQDSMLRATQYERILQDLITELRARHPAGDYCCCGWCDRDKEAADRLIAESRAWLAGDHPEPLIWMLNRAERRLKEVQGE